MGKPSLSTNFVDQIKNLRSKGHSIAEISTILNLPKTTVYRYSAAVEILPEYLNVWKSKQGGSQKRMLEELEHAYLQGKNFVGVMSKKEKLLFLSALYWAEGNKKDFSLTNSDPNLISVFVNILKEEFNISNADLKISIRIYEDLNKETCLSFWSKIVGIPTDKFVSVNVLSGKKVGKLKYGMCRIRIVKGGRSLKKIQGINKAIAECFSIIP